MLQEAPVPITHTEEVEIPISETVFYNAKLLNQTVTRTIDLTKRYTFDGVFMGTNYNYGQAGWIDKGVIHYVSSGISGGYVAFSLSGSTLTMKATHTSIPCIFRVFQVN